MVLKNYEEIKDAFYDETKLEGGRIIVLSEVMKHATYQEFRINKRDKKPNFMYVGVLSSFTGIRRNNRGDKEYRRKSSTI